MTHAPHGLFGGANGHPASNLLNPGPGETRLPTLPTAPLKLNAGDVFSHRMGGGGGYGDPFKRDPEMVLQDGIEGRVSRDQARIAYGVILSNEGIDPEETARLRTRHPHRRRSRQHTAPRP